VIVEVEMGSACSSSSDVAAQPNVGAASAPQRQVRPTQQRHYPLIVGCDECWQQGGASSSSGGGVSRKASIEEKRKQAADAADQRAAKQRPAAV
jgi:hypothetical protein